MIIDNNNTKLVIKSGICFLYHLWIRFKKFKRNKLQCNQIKSSTPFVHTNLDYTNTLFTSTIHHVPHSHTVLVGSSRHPRDLVILIWEVSYIFKYFQNMTMQSRFRFQWSLFIYNWYIMKSRIVLTHIISTNKLKPLPIVS